MDISKKKNRSKLVFDAVNEEVLKEFTFGIWANIMQ